MIFDFALNVKNNTGSFINAPLLNASGFRGTFNSRIKFAADLTGVDLNAPTVGIQVRSNSSAIFSTYTAPLLTQTIQGVADALNTLNVGVFWVSGNMVVTTNSLYTYAYINIGDPVVYSNGFIFSVHASGGGSTSVNIVAPGGISITGYIDWGDGTIEMFNNTSFPFPDLTLNHFYAAGDYNASIYFSSDTSVITQMSFVNSELSRLVNLRGMTGLQSLTVSGNPDLSMIDVSGCSLLNILSVNNTGISLIDTTDCVLLTNLNASNCLITTVDFSSNVQLSFVDLSNNQINSINLTGLNALNQLEIAGNNLTALDLRNLPSLNNVVAVGNPLSSVLVNPATPLEGSTSITGSNLPVSNVNAILINMNAQGSFNGSVDLSGQTPAAPPSGAGITAKNNLTGRGWTVVTD